MTDSTTQDPQDKAFGAAASRDQEIVDELEDWGAEERDLPGKPEQAPRAAGKARPEREPDASETTDAVGNHPS